MLTCPPSSAIGMPYLGSARLVFDLLVVPASLSLRRPRLTAFVSQTHFLSRSLMAHNHNYLFLIRVRALDVSFMLFCGAYVIQHVQLQRCLCFRHEERRGVFNVDGLYVDSGREVRRSELLTRMNQ